MHRAYVKRHGGSVAMLGCGRRSIKGYSHKGRREAGGWGGYFSRLKSPIVHGGCARNCRVEASRARLKCFISFSSPTAGFECCFGEVPRNTQPQGCSSYFAGARHTPFFGRSTLGALTNSGLPKDCVSVGALRCVHTTYSRTPLQLVGT